MEFAKTFLGDRIGETISGETAAVVVSVFGDDLDTLDREAGDIAAALSSTKGAVDVQVVSPPGAPQMAVHLRLDRVRQYGREARGVRAVPSRSHGVTDPGHG